MPFKPLSSVHLLYGTACSALLTSTLLVLPAQAQPGKQIENQQTTSVSLVNRSADLALGRRFSSPLFDLNQQFNEAEVIPEESPQPELLLVNSRATKKLNSAVKRGDIKVIRSLIDDGADVNNKDKNNWTPLHLASKRGYVKIVKILIDAGANLSLSNQISKTTGNDQKGSNPINLAIQYNHNETAKLLINEMSKFIVDTGNNVNSKDKNGWTPLHFMAMFSDDTEKVKALIDSEADVNAMDNEGFTPLHMVGNVGIAQLLIDAEADVNAMSNEGFTPLHTISNVGIAQLLIDADANVNTIDNYGDTPLHHAKNVRIAQLLIDAGSNVRAVNNKGFKPVDSAYKSGRSGVERMLAGLDGPSSVRAEDDRERERQARMAALEAERQASEAERQASEARRQLTEAEEAETYRSYISYMRNCLAIESLYSDKELIEKYKKYQTNNYSVEFYIKDCIEKYYGQ